MLSNGEGEGFDDPVFKPKKKRKNGRTKGKIGEREVAKLCADWWAAIEPGCEFRSTPSSGGWATPQLRGHFKVAGDLTTTAKLWPFTVEVKRREAWVLHNLYAAKPSPVWGWWKQACKAAAEEGRAPILFLRHNSKAGQAAEWFVMLPDVRETHQLLPRLDSWCWNDKRPPVDVRPLLTTWEVLSKTAPAAIIRACASASPQALAAPLASPQPKSNQTPKAPRKARQRPAQAGASSALEQHPDPEFRKTAMLRQIAEEWATPPKRSATASPKSKRVRS